MVTWVMRLVKGRAGGQAGLRLWSPCSFRDHPCDSVADWEPWLAAATQHHKYPTAYRLPRKSQTSKLETISTARVWLSRHCEVKNL